ncbi:MAG: Hsp70 family protein, partial [Kordiimonadaceae bacterium]|nr:Hsp70 family protein [Kordiimonadaceae bacterium]
QGEREMAADNKILGQFDLVGIPAAARGIPQIEVTFDIDANGIVNVSAKDKGTGKEHAIRIQASGGLSDSDIEDMIKQAEANAEDDKKRREMVDAKNKAESLSHTVEGQLKEHSDKLEEGDKEAIEDAIKSVKEALESEDLEAITGATGTLEQAAMKLGEVVYKDQADGEADGGDAADADAAASEAEDDNDDIVDADFEEVEDDKK